MKKFLAILILIFSLQTPSQADDISEFEIEGISIGDSALDFFTEGQIKDNSFDYYNDKLFRSFWKMCINLWIYYVLKLFYNILSAIIAKL